MRKHWMAALMAVGMVGGTAMAQSASSAASPEAAAQQRDRVQQDLQLWHAAGMSFLPSNVMHEDLKQTPEYRRYQQLRAEQDLQERFARQLEAEPTAATLPAPSSKP